MQKLCGGDVGTARAEKPSRSMYHSIVLAISATRNTGTASLILALVSMSAIIPSLC
jgi:hypothetical protein